MRFVSHSRCEIVNPFYDAALTLCPRFSMRSFLYIFLYLLCTFSSAWADSHPVKTTVCFTPGADCAGFIVNAVHEAKRSVFVQAYHFTEMRIAAALIDAHQRGVRVLLIIDRHGLHPNEHHPHFDNPIILAFLKHNIPVWIDDRPRIAHNKVMIIDRESVITGSFNFTYSAQNFNAENVVWLQDHDIAQDYTQNFFNRLLVGRKISFLR